MLYSRNQIFVICLEELVRLKELFSWEAGRGGEIIWVFCVVLEEGFKRIFCFFEGFTCGYYECLVGFIF